MGRLTKFILLTGTAPGEPGVGGVILQDLMEVSGFESAACCWLAPRHGRKEPYLFDVATTVQPRRFETGYRPVHGLVGEVISAVALRGLRPGMIRKACTTVERLIRSLRPKFLLAVLESPAAIQVALAVHLRTGIPIRAIVWDDVDLFCRQAMFDRWTRRWIERSFQKVLKISERVAVICENMRSAYLVEHGVNSFVLRHGIKATAIDSGRPANSRRNYDLIGFAGSNTAPDCLKSLLQALDQIEWRLNGREIALRLIGARHVLESRQPQRIEYFGWRTVIETRELLAECDVLYLPQSFTPESRRFSTLSFPTKLSTYVAARRPIFLHAPDYASLMGFWQQHELGPRCQELTVERVLDTVKGMLANTTDRNEKWLNEIRRVHAEVLSPTNFAEGVRRLIE